MTFATGDMKRTKSSGPRTEPRGTPLSMVVEGEEDESIFTKNERSVRYIYIYTEPCGTPYSTTRIGGVVDLDELFPAGYVQLDPI